MPFSFSYLSISFFTRYSIIIDKERASVSAIFKLEGNVHYETKISGGDGGGTDEAGKKLIKLNLNT